MQIGGKLKRGKPHDGRAPDYDDWTLNGDLLFWHEPLEQAIEISSMGIRVDPAALDRQLSEAGCDERRTLPFHKMLLAGELPLTIGGGIGQSRLCMLLLGKVPVGEVQVTLGADETRAACRAAGVPLLLYLPDVTGSRPSILEGRAFFRSFHSFFAFLRYSSF